MEDLNSLKDRLHQYCSKLVLQRIENARSAMEEAAFAANQETKSSVGDKYETGRAMMQNEKEKNKVQLLKAMQLKNDLAEIPTNSGGTEVQPGSLVLTNHGIFYFAIGLGKIMLEDQAYFIISLQAPLGKLMKGRKAGDEIVFQDRTYRLKELV